MPSQLIPIAAEALEGLSDEEKPMLELWVVEVLESAKRRSPKQVSDALARVDYLRLEQFRCSIADQAIADWDHLLDEDEKDVLSTPLPSGMDRNAKNRLLEVLRYVKRLDTDDQRFVASREPARTKRRHPKRGTKTLIDA